MINNNQYGPVSPSGEIVNQPPSPRYTPAGGLRGSRWSRPARRLTAVILAVLLVLVVILLLVGNEQGGDAAARSVTGTCDPVVTTPTNLNRDHVQDDSGFRYPDGPPSFGPHLGSAAPFGRSFYTAADRPRIGALVHSMEHGFTVIWYDEEAAGDPTAMTTLAELARRYDIAGLRVIVAPWRAADGGSFPDTRHYALTRWSADAADPKNQVKQRGNWMYCAGLDVDAFETFVRRWTNAESPEPGIGLPESSRT